MHNPVPKNNETGGLTQTKISQSLGAASLIVVLGMGLGTVPAHAGQPACQPDLITRPPPSEPGPDGYAIELEGDSVESVGEDTITLRGDAFMQRGPEALFGDELTYYRNTGEVEGEGNLIYHSLEGDRIEGSYIKFEVETHIGEADNIKYRIADRENKPEDPTKAYLRARGEAEKAYFEGHDVTRLQKVRYTTCAEGDNSVWLRAKEITLDQATGRGLAKNISVRFKKIPIFWFPRISFPINDERKTGFLFPSFGVEEGSGFVLETPYYWNIRPNLDFTLYPRWYEKRGLQVGGELRYLTRKSRGYVYGEYMPDDTEFDGDRGAFTYKHEQDFTEKIDGEIDVQHVSDNEYFDDFSNDIEISSSSQLPQEARVNYRGNIWDFGARVFAYQVIDDNVLPESEPSDRLPILTADADWEYEPWELEVEFAGEAVNFVHDVNLEGWRIDATPEVKREFENAWGYVTPKAKYRYTTYALDNVNPGEEDNPDRGVPVFSLDSGIYFDRRTSWRGSAFINTLEPRVFYVYIPDVDESDLPVFDTGPINLNNFSNIWREERFFGADRVGNTNQVTFGLTSRMLEAETGDEWMEASIGMIYFIEDRDDELNDGEVLDDRTSDFLAEARAKLTPKWNTYGFLQWNTQDNKVEEGRFDLRYRQEARRFLDIGYRFSDGSTEQVTLSGQWRFRPRWHIIGEERFSIRDEENLETLVGLEYDGCCWKVRSFFQRRRQSDESFRDAFILQFELTGLATIRAGV